MKEPNNSIYSAASLALRVIFLSFIDVELIRFFHVALRMFSVYMYKLKMTSPVEQWNIGDTFVCDAWPLQRQTPSEPQSNSAVWPIPN